MASKYLKITSSTQITDQPGTVDRIVVGSHNGSTIKIWDDTGEEGQAMTGTLTPTQSHVDIGGFAGTAIYASVDAGEGGSVEYTVFFNGDPLR